MELGQAMVRREGKDITVVATQVMMHRSLEVAENLAEEGIDIEVIDLRSMVPLDKDTVLNSIAKTNRLVVVEEAPHSAGWGGDIVSLAADEGIYWLEAPVKRVNMGEVLVPSSAPLEDAAMPNVDRIAGAIYEVMQS
jgi:pyruvate dehydrogenase E1 component beta subunit